MPKGDEAVAEGSSAPSLILPMGQEFEDLDGVDLLGFVREHNATLVFPQKLMLMLTHMDREKSKLGNSDPCVSWTDDGRAFVIRNRKDFVKHILPLFFREAKYSSFTRKLYRWGFRQTHIPKGHDRHDRDMIFGNEFFQRDDKALLSNMKSVTAAGTRRALLAAFSRSKRSKNAQAREKEEVDVKGNTENDVDDEPEHVGVALPLPLHDQPSNPSPETSPRHPHHEPEARRATTVFQADGRELPYGETKTPEETTPNAQPLVRGPRSTTISNRTASFGVDTRTTQQDSTTATTTPEASSVASSMHAMPSPNAAISSGFMLPGGGRGLEPSFLHSTLPLSTLTRNMASHLLQRRTMTPPVMLQSAEQTTVNRLFQQNAINEAHYLAQLASLNPAQIALYNQLGAAAAPTTAYLDNLRSSFLRMERATVPSLQATTQQQNLELLRQIVEGGAEVTNSRGRDDETPRAPS